MSDGMGMRGSGLKARAWFLFFWGARGLFLALTLSPVQVIGLEVVKSLKPEVYRRVVRDREIRVYANLEDKASKKHPDWKRYEYYAAVLIRASPRFTHEVLTDYKVFRDLIPFVDQADFDPKTNILEIQGGIWSLKLRSKVRFYEKTEKWIQFKVIQGHFQGMQGSLVFERPWSVKGGNNRLGTVVYFTGALEGAGSWPAAFVLERGAEIVLSVTAKKMRSYIEGRKRSHFLKEKGQNGSKTRGEGEVPKPQTHL